MTDCNAQANLQRIESCTATAWKLSLPCISNLKKSRVFEAQAAGMNCHMQTIDLPSTMLVCTVDLDPSDNETFSSQAASAADLDAATNQPPPAGALKTMRP